jgi:hypothetical protein
MSDRNDHKEGLEVLPHSTYMTLSNYHLFRTVDDQTRGQHYENNDAIQESVQGVGIDSYCSGICKFMQH